MTLLLPVAPTPLQVIVAILAVLGGALIATVSVFLARRTGNWINHIGTAGGLLIVAGVVGQRTPVDGRPTGLWDAAITVPILGVRLDPVAAAGIIVTLVGLILALLFERVPDPDDPPRPLVHRPLEDDDTV